MPADRSMELVARFLPPNGRVVLLPRYGRPRIALAGRSPSERWRQSRSYPAFRWPARVRRLGVRAWAAIAAGRTYPVVGHEWATGSLLLEAFPDAVTAVLLFGTPSPFQKLVIQVWGQRGVLGYVKYADHPAAAARVAREHAILTTLGGSVGPRVVAYGSVADGRALALEAVAGATLRPRSIPGVRERALLDRMARGPAHPVARHPWIERMRAAHPTVLEPWLEPLADREWPVVVHHGDFAPWNLVGSGTGAVRAVDWECASLDGFPHLDHAHYVLQVAALIRRWSPGQARSFATAHLAGTVGHPAAEALVRLAALADYAHALEHGGEVDSERQRWRRGVWDA